MKYRQWKKDYKKEHGINPPLELDRRKQHRIMKKTVRAISRIDFESAIRIIICGAKDIIRRTVSVLEEPWKVCRDEINRFHEEVIAVCGINERQDKENGENNN